MLSYILVYYLKMPSGGEDNVEQQILKISGVGFGDLNSGEVKIENFYEHLRGTSSYDICKPK